MLFSHCLDILNNLLFGFVFFKSRLMAQWTCIRALNPWLMPGPFPPSLDPLPCLPWVSSSYLPLPLACDHCPSLAEWPNYMGRWRPVLPLSPLDPPGAWKQCRTGWVRAKGRLFCPRLSVSRCVHQVVQWRPFFCWWSRCRVWPSTEAVVPWSLPVHCGLWR